MARKLRALTAAFMTKLLAPDRELRRQMKQPAQPIELPCANPDCKKPTKATFCSPECCKAFKQNYNAVGGYNVRIDHEHNH